MDYLDARIEDVQELIELAESLLSSEKREDDLELAKHLLDDGKAIMDSLLKEKAMTELKQENAQLKRQLNQMACDRVDEQVKVLTALISQHLVIFCLAEELKDPHMCARACMKITELKQARSKMISLQMRVV